MPKVTRKFVNPIGRKSVPVLIDNFLGLNTTAPYTDLKDGVSPYMINVRLYARNSSDRRIAVGTRKGPSSLSTPAGEALDQQEASTTGASDQSLNSSQWVAMKFTAGASGRLTKVEVNVKIVDSTQHLLVDIYSDSGGSPSTRLATSSILLTDSSTSYAYETARFVEAPSISSGTSYWVVLRKQDGGSGSWSWSSTTNTTVGKTSTNSGGTWTASNVSYNFKTYIATTGAVLGTFEYRPSTGANKKLFAHGTNVYTVDDGTGAITSIKSGLSSSATEYSFAQAEDRVYYTNGYDVVQKWDGSTNSATTISTTGSQLAFHKNRLFIVDSANPTRIVFSDLGDYESFESTSFLYVPTPKSGDNIIGITVFQDNLVVLTRNTKYVLFGDDPGNFVLRQSSGKKGAVSRQSIKSDSNYVYFLSDDGIYRYNGSSDQLISDSIQNAIDSINDKTKAFAVTHNNYYRLYCPSQISASVDQCFLWDTINSFWLNDTETYVAHPFVTEDNQLIEASSLAGFLMNGEQQYSDMGKPINFKWWSKYFGDGIRKVFMRRLIPAIRLQTLPYNIDLMIDIDQRNTTPISYTISAQASGSTWGGGITWGGGATWGSAVVSTPRTYQGTEAYWHQVRIEHQGVDTPVEILSYEMELRTRRTK